MTTNLTLNFSKTSINLICNDVTAVITYEGKIMVVEYDEKKSALSYKEVSFLQLLNEIYYNQQNFQGDLEEIKKMILSLPQTPSLANTVDREITTVDACKMLGLSKFKLQKELEIQGITKTENGKYKLSDIQRIVPLYRIEGL